MTSVRLRRPRLALAVLAILGGQIVAACGAGAPATTPAATIPAGWVTVRIDDPKLTMSFPPGWTTVPLATVRNQMAASLPKMTGDSALIEQWALDQIDGGKTRYIAQGPAALAGVTISMTVTVESNDASLAAAADRITQETTQHHGGDLVDRTDRTLTIGSAILLRWTQNPTGGAVPAQTRDYIVRLGDGRTLTLSSTSVAQDTGFEAYIERIVGTFALAP